MNIRLNCKYTARFYYTTLNKTEKDKIFYIENNILENLFIDEDYYRTNVMCYHKEKQIELIETVML